MARAQVWLGLLAALLEVVCIALLVLLARGNHPTKVDRAIDDWLQSHPVPWLEALAWHGAVVGNLPVLATLTLLLLGMLWFLGRPRRELVTLFAVFVASELIGLLLIALLRSRHVEPMPAQTWPYGFAGLIPLRALAVYGVMARLVARQRPRGGPPAGRRSPEGDRPFPGPFAPGGTALTAARGTLQSR
jgi:hypothetical protein